MTPSLTAAASSVAVCSSWMMENTAFYSFALRLALLYLQAEGITPQPDPSNPQHLRLGRTTIRPLEMNDGGYVGADVRGYQFLLDFKGARGSFLTFSLTALLSGDIDPQASRQDRGDRRHG